MVSCRWDSVAQATAEALLGVVVLSWVVVVVSMRGGLYKAMLGESVLLRCVSVRIIRGHGGFNLIIDGVYGAFIIENGTPTLALKMKEIRVFGAKKRMESWQATSWFRTCSKRRFGEKYCIDRIMFLCRMSSLEIKKASSYEDMTRRS